MLGIDPGFHGALVATDGKRYLRIYEMPLQGENDERPPGKRVDVDRLKRLLSEFLTDHWAPQIFLERAIPMAMGAKGAFTYGRGYEALILAIEQSGIAFTEVEPAKWTKAMHRGILKDLKPKAKSLIAVKRLYPQLVGSLPRRPKTRALLDGPVDALLIAGYGLRRVDPEGFY